MNQKAIVTLVIAALSGPAWAQDKPPTPSIEQMIKGATGAVVGGVLGSQVGQGDGKTAATAAGAATGAVVGSGCKPTLGSAIGAALGGFFGSQIGGDNKNAVAGAGAAVGAVLGSDCQPEKPVQANAVGDQPSTYGAEPVIGETVVGGGNGGRGGKPAPMIGRVITVNGIALTEVAPEEFPMGKFVGFPVVSKKADFVKLDEMTKAYTKASWEAAARKDFEAFTVNRHLAMKLAEFRLHHKIATVGFVDSLVNSDNGTGTLAPGATIFLPGFTRWGKNDVERVAATPSAADYMAAILDANVGEVNWADAPKTADLGGMLNSVIGAAAGAIKNGGGIGNINTQKQVGELLGKLPIGAVFSARDVNGNSFLVERTKDGFNVGNTSGRPVQIPLGAFGFVPELPVPDAARRTVAQIAVRMQDVAHKLYTDLRREHAAAGFQWHAKGVRISSNVLNIHKTVQFDKNGYVTTDPRAIAERDKEWEARGAYTWAYVMGSMSPAPGHWKSNYSDWKRSYESKCYQTFGNVSFGKEVSMAWRGEFAEILEFACYKPERIDYPNMNGFVRTGLVYGAPLHSEQWFVSPDGKKMQTFASLMKDKKLAENLKTADGVKDLAEAIIGLVPGIGNADSAGACFTGDSLTNMVYKNLVSSGENYRAFISDLLPSPKDETVLDKSLSCASAIPALGTPVKAISKAGYFVGLYSDWAKSEKAAGVFKAMAFLDTKMLDNTVPVYKDFAGVSGQTISAVKNYYDNFQRMRARDAVVDSAMQVINGS